MKIGLVRRGYSSTGGAEAFINRFSDALVTAGHDIALFTTRRWPNNSWHREIHRLSGSTSPIRFADALLQTAAVDRCEVLFSFERIHSCECYRAGDGVHKAWLERRGRHESWFKKFARRFNSKHTSLLGLERELFRDGGAGQVIVNSNMVKEEIQRFYDYPEERIHVIYNGLPEGPPPEEHAARRLKAREKLDFDDDEYLLLFAGSGWGRKGLHWAIEAVDEAALPKTTLLVAGRGDPDAVQQSNRVRHLGAVHDMPLLLAGVDAFILPTMYDPFSNACLEALAAGLPVITTKDNGFHEIMDDGADGDVVSDSSDVDALVAAITRWSDPALRERARPQLQAKGAQFRIENNVRQTLDVLMKSTKASDR